VFVVYVKRLARLGERKADRAHPALALHESVELFRLQSVLDFAAAGAVLLAILRFVAALSFILLRAHSGLFPVATVRSVTAILASSYPAALLPRVLMKLGGWFRLSTPRALLRQLFVCLSFLICWEAQSSNLRLISQW